MIINKNLKIIVDLPMAFIPFYNSLPGVVSRIREVSLLIMLQTFDPVYQFNAGPAVMVGAFP